MDWTQRLRLSNLQMLTSLARTGNMSRSAEALNTTQPALSKWLRELEDEIGLPLFERHARGLRPTSHGSVLIAHAQRIEGHLDSARADMSALREGGSGAVVVGTSAASASDVVPLAVMRLLEQAPRAHVRLTENTLNVLMEKLSAGELDVVIGRTAPDLHDAQIESEMLYVEPIHVVARTQHPLFRKRALAWTDLMGYRWLVWPKGTPIRSTLDEALSSAGQSLPVEVIESNSLSFNISLLNYSNMIGMASHRTAQRYSLMGALRVLPITLEGFGSVSVYYRTDSVDRSLIVAFLAAVRYAVDQTPGQNPD